MRQRFRPMTLNTRPGQLQHSRAGIDAVDVDLGMSADELAKEAAVTFADDECPRWPRSFVDPMDPSVLQSITEHDRFERAIEWRNSIEAHRIF